ncbi:ferredoxin-NADP reductase [Kitasatospora acidiphila]|uniref:ferredoxin--NADP(+) reductase n=1 Tax=Kitasatospora acidiphila TaxID=2567942 RepID=A0A540WD26_9ACTN|nr:FAD-dependent oxidoreductase [Kitasatospora acidiphila]TQF06797.1 ferredoxin-NADP reductase [Kitasatospora acidiphila]
MAYAITQNCCTDATCISVCPVNCIHPTPEEPGFGHTDLLYIDPAACIDCGACADACPVDAIFPVDRLAGSLARYGEVNRQYYQENPNTHAWGKPEFPRSIPADLGTLRVAVVGTGPAAAYTAQELLRTAGAEVTMIDRQPMAGGLLRHGVAPDHQATKRIGDSFAQLYRNPRLRLHLNVEIGRDLSAADLAAHHHAVVYAVGATADRRLEVPGEELPGVLGAGTVVGWYNADPDVPAVAVDLSAERAVVVGNGNVALDIARVLLSDPERLAGTDIADHALAALRGSSVREVVLLARRGSADAAYTAPEFLALRQLPGVAVVVASDEALPEAVEGKSALLDGLPVEAVDWTGPPPAGRRIVLRFLERPAEFFGQDRVEGVRLASGGLIPAGLVVRAIGFRGAPLPELPLDEATGTVPNRNGRVVPGSYVAGWVKRGPTGGIGANRACAKETVDALLDDAAAGLLPPPPGSAADFDRLVRRRCPEATGLRELRAIDRLERERGAAGGRPRVKLATAAELLSVRGR